MLKTGNKEKSSRLEHCPLYWHCIKKSKSPAGWTGNSAMADAREMNA